ncbi:GIN domain-containing protein [Pedobacter sp.]|uniref:GIN domain-containing protein n=1 Tax=Pedobacter sp. TaxID=1411316 RepID=UPI003BAB22A2
MKTLFKTLFASSLAVVLSTTAIFANPTIENGKLVKAEQKLAFKRIKVSGNVELTIIQGSRSSVSYSAENSGKVKVTQQGDGLNIEAADNTPAKITVYVNDLYRIHATDNAKVKTEGQLKSQYLQVFLSGNASLDLNSRSEGLYTVIEDDSQLSLKGSTGDHNLVMSRNQKINMDKFTAVNTKTNYVAENAFAFLAK